VAESFPTGQGNLNSMRVKLPAARIFGAILAGSLGFSAAGCSLMAGDFAPRTANATAVSTVPAGTLETTPAVLVDGAAANVATVAPPRASSIDNLPPLPKEDGSPPNKLNPTDKARVIAELEALARGEIPTGNAAVVAKPECTVTSATTAASATRAGAQPAAAPAGCPTSKPALRP
jgi:hypothetical protein